MLEIAITAFTVASMIVRTTVFVVHVIGRCLDPLPPEVGPQLPDPRGAVQDQPFQTTHTYEASSVQSPVSSAQQSAHWTLDTQHWTFQQTYARTRPVVEYWWSRDCAGCRRFALDFPKGGPARDRLDAAYEIRPYEFERHRQAAAERGINALPAWVLTQERRVILGYEGPEQLLVALAGGPTEPAPMPQARSPRPQTFATDQTGQPESAKGAGTGTGGQRPEAGGSGDQISETPTAAAPASASALATGPLATLASPASGVQSPEPSNQSTDQPVNTDEPQGLVGRARAFVLEIIRGAINMALAWFVAWRAQQGFLKRRLLDRAVAKALQRAEAKASETVGAGRVRVAKQFLKKGL